MDTVPLLDLGDPDRPGLVRTLHDALHTWGFVGLVGHGLPDGLVDRCYRHAAALFALPESVKRRHETPADGRQRGWTPFGLEHAKDHPVGDLKEFWHVGRPDASGDRIPPNRFPAELPELAPDLLALFAHLDAVALRVLGWIAEGLALPSDYFVEQVRGGNSVLRVLHYPPLPDAVAAGAIRAAPHEDVNLITLLPVATAPGLEILTPEGRWLPVEPPPGAIICDTGDMMQLVTSGRLRSTTHRVVNPRGPNVARYSLPFFVHPRPEVALDPIDGSGPGPTARAFLEQRLREIGLS